MTAAGRREEGSGSLYLLTLMMLVLICFAATAVLGSAVGLRHRVEAAADLAALAGAAAVGQGDAAACGRAAQVARANGGRLTVCRVSDLNCEVAVSATPRGLLAGVPAPTARSRAGPVESDPAPAEVPPGLPAG